MAQLPSNQPISRVFAPRLRALQARVIGDAERAQAAAVEAGAVAMDGALEDAVTATGLFRMLMRGGNPGRHDTGNMVSKIRQNGATPAREGARTTMAFGWFAGDFEAYFAQQDLGTSPIGDNKRGIPPAHALRAGARVAREVFRSRVEGSLR